MKNLETNRKLKAVNRRNTRRSENCIWNLFLQLQWTQTKPITFIWAQRVKTSQETITFADKKKNTFSYWDPKGTLEKIKHYLAATKSVKFASEGLDCLQSAFSLKIRLVFISSSAIANHDVIITIRDWDQTRLTPSFLAARGSRLCRSRA